MFATAFCGRVCPAGPRRRAESSPFAPVLRLPTPSGGCQSVPGWHVGRAVAYGPPGHWLLIGQYSRKQRYFVETGGFSALSPQCPTRQGKALSGRTPGPPVEGGLLLSQVSRVFWHFQHRGCAETRPQVERFAWWQGPRERGPWTRCIDSVSSAEGVFHVLGTGAPHATPAAPFSPGPTCFHAT